MLVHKTRPRSGISTGVQLYILGGLGAAFILITALNLFKSTPAAMTGNEPFLTYSNSDFHYSLSYPSDWKVVPGGANSGVTTIASRVTSPDSTGAHYSVKGINQSQKPASSNQDFSKVDIIPFELEEPMTAQQFLQAKSSGAVEGRISPVKITGLDALMVEVQTAESPASHQENIVYKSVFVTSGNFGYIIAGFADPDTFDHIVKSFQAN